MIKKYLKNHIKRTKTVHEREIRIATHLKRISEGVENQPKII